MLLLLAALVQAPPTLEADQYGAARTCAIVSRTNALASGKPPTLTMITQGVYFVIAAAVAKPAGKAVADRMKELFEELHADQSHSPEEAAALYPQCGIRFPLSLNTSSVTLPTNVADRTILCAISASFVLGMAQSHDSQHGDQSEGPRAQTIATYYQAGFARALAARGADTPAKEKALMNERLGETIELGTLSAIENSCEAAMR